MPRLAAVWLLAVVTGAYTVYGGLTAVAWTSSFQCVLLLGGGLYVFFAGLARIGWNVTAMLGSGQQAHLFTPAGHEVPWPALVVLMLSTNVWYYATNQYINQRCLAARDEWHAKMGVLFAVALQLLIPFATCFPGMIYRVINPNLENPDAAYPMVVAAVVPVGLRGLVVAAIVSAIMSTISGLVNSTATLFTLDLVARRPGTRWSEEQLVRAGRWSGGIAVLIGAAFAPVVMKWQNIFRYAQDIWAPMAAPVVVVFLAGAWWPGASGCGAVACLWLAAVAVPLILAKAFLADVGVHFLPPNLENPMVFAGTYGLMALAVMAAASLRGGAGWRWGAAAAAIAAFFVVGAMNPTAVAVMVLAVTVIVASPLVRGRREPQAYLWDRTMLGTPGVQPWYGHLGVWWCVLAAILIGIYVWLW